MNPNPKINIEAAANEVKLYLDKKKMDLVDWNYWNIECYPPPDDDDYPELKNFAIMWNDFFDHADHVTQDDGQGFPNDIANKYEAETARIADSVNDDADFWELIREEIRPLYKAPPGAA